MGLRLKFNLVLLVVFVLGLGVTAYISWTLLQKNAREEVVRNAGLMMEAALAIRAYTVDQVRPQLELQLMRVFLPQSVPAYAATETLGQIKQEVRRLLLQGGDPQSDQPAQPGRRLGGRHRPRVQGQVRTHRDDRRARHADGPVALHRAAHPDHEPRLSACHTTPEMAPATMVKLYGPRQRLRLEAQRDHRRPGRLGADDRARSGTRSARFSRSWAPSPRCSPSSSWSST